MQWGIGVGGNKVTFPVAFASTMYMACAGDWHRDADSYEGSSKTRLAWYTPTKTQIDFLNDENSSYRKTYWLAVGK